MSRRGQFLRHARISCAKGPCCQQDLHLRQSGPELMNHFADTRDILLTDAAEQHQVWITRHYHLRDPVVFFVVVAPASTPHVHGRGDVSLGVGLGQFGDPRGTHRVVDDAVANRHQPQLTTFGENLARA